MNVPIGRLARNADSQPADEMRPAMNRFLAVIAVTILSGCSGNSCPPGPKGCGDIGGFNFPSDLSSAPGEAALVAYLRASHQRTLSARDNSGNSYSLQVDSMPNSGTTTFNGSAPAYSTVDTLSLEKNGVPATSSVSTDYYLLDPFVPLGRTYSTDTPLAVVTSSTPFPATLNVGSSGSVANITYYHDSTMTSVDANETWTYLVKASNPVNLLMCLSFVVSDVTIQGTADGLAAGTQTDCYSVDDVGNAGLVSIALPVNGVPLDFR
jgi:hypothetical protein